LSRRKTGLVFGVWMVFVLLVAVFGVVLNVPVVGGSGTIYIRADGSIDPPTAPITSVENITYTFTANIHDSIVVEKDNIVVEGAGYTVQGTGSGIGVDLREKSNVTIEHIHIKNFTHGIHLRFSNNITIAGNNIIGNKMYGIYLETAGYNTISENNITTNGWVGIDLEGARENFLSGNNVTNNGIGVLLSSVPLWSSDNNILSGNNISANKEFGVALSGGSNNVLKNNLMAGNRFNFGVAGGDFSDFIHDIDSSNTVDGKPVYYWINRRDVSIPSDAGYVALINSYNITVRGLEFKNNKHGILFVGTTSSKIESNKVTNSWNGIMMRFGSSNNIISGNSITNTTYGIWLGEHSSSNSIYHNNFANNTNQIYTYDSENLWDDGYPSGGNYWSDYVGVDNYSGVYQNETSSDGIGDTPYGIDANNEDRYSFIKPWGWDKNPPVSIDGYDNVWRTADFTITLTATDDLSGVAETFYRINDGSTKTVNADGQPFIATEGANNKLEYWSIDNAGNEELPHKILSGIKLDKTEPTAYAGQDQTVNVGVAVTFDGGASTDNVGIVSYDWDFGDGATATGKTTTHTYTNIGTYTVTLTARDAAGNTATDAMTVIVLSAEPFPMWIPSAIIAAIGIVVAVTLLLRKRK